MKPCLRAPLRAAWTAPSSTSMRCACAMAGAATGWRIPATAASGLFGSIACGRCEMGGLGMPEGGGTDGGGIGVGPPMGRAIGGGAEGRCTGTAAAGAGVGAPAGPPMRCKRALRSIFGFLSSAIVTPGETYVPERSRVNARSAGRLCK